ncbi:GIY-YIG nuclease family protein [Pseudomonas silvicola]|nr:GIY-YIG nuclease family protein [Pseudomonas silvicola]
MTQIQKILFMETSHLPSICQRSRCLRDAVGKTNYCDAHQPKPKAPPPPWRGKSVVYVVGMQGEPYAKVGFATELSSRMIGMQVGSPKPMLIHCVFRGSMRAEATLHRVLQDHHVRGEWFHLEPVKALCERLAQDREERIRLELTGLICPWSDDGYHWDAKGIPMSSLKRMRINTGLLKI